MQAALELGINYSSAKFIFGQYRDKNTSLDVNKVQENAKECCFKRLHEN